MKASPNKLEDAQGDALYAAALAEVILTIVAAELPSSTVRRILDMMLRVLDDAALAGESTKGAVRRARVRAEGLIRRHLPPD